MHPPPPRLLLIALAVIPLRLAHAEDSREEKIRLAENVLSAKAAAVSDAKTKAYFGNNQFADDPAVCTQAIETATGLGVKPSDTYYDRTGEVLWKHAPKICAEYARLHPLRAAIDAIKDPLAAVRIYTGPDGKPDPSIAASAFRQVVETAKACVATADKLIAAGVPSDVKFSPADSEGDPAAVTLTEARAACHQFIDWGGKAAVADDERVAAAYAAAVAKWKQLGFAGDRLEYVVGWGDHSIYGKGCGELSVKQLKTASAYFQISEDDTTWTVYKTSFKKNKKVGYVVRKYGKAGTYKCE